VQKKIERGATLVASVAAGGGGGSVADEFRKMKETRKRLKENTKTQSISKRVRFQSDCITHTHTPPPSNKKIHRMWK